MPAYCHGSAAFSVLANTDGRQHKSRARLGLSVSDMASATAKVARRLLDHAATDAPNCLRISREQPLPASDYSFSKNFLKLLAAESICVSEKAAQSSRYAWGGRSINR